MSGMNRNRTELFMNKHGMDISMFDESFVNKTILQRIDLTGCSDMADYSRFVAENETEAVLFTGLLQVSYSEFFRNPLTFSVLESIVLPEMDGIQALKALRSDGRLQHTPVIALTASALKEDRELVLAHGFNAFIVKPIDESIFFNTLNETLYGK